LRRLLSPLAPCFAATSRIYTTTSAIHFCLSRGPSCIVNLLLLSRPAILLHLMQKKLRGCPRPWLPTLVTQTFDWPIGTKATVPDALNFHLLPLQSFVVDDLLHRIQPGFYLSPWPGPSVPWCDTLAKGAAVRGIR